MRKLGLFFLSGWMLALLIVVAAPQIAQAKEGVWEGTVAHVSTANIKVYNPTAKQTLSFLILPKFKQIFSDDGKTTIQMAEIKPGAWVKVYYDQKLVGVRHADKIVLVTKGKAIKS